MAAGNVDMDAVVTLFKNILSAQDLQGSKQTNAFNRHLETLLDQRRIHRGVATLRTQPGLIDFSNNDALSISADGALRKEFLAELERHPDFVLGSTGARMLDGNTTYIENLEDTLAKFHGAETGTIFNTGYEANGAIFSTLPVKGDALLYDELIHASAHDGMRHTEATIKEAFRHNSVEDMRQQLEYIRDSNDEILEGEKTVHIAVESVYSMDGDICPLAELVEVAKDELPEGNFVIIVDEAHTNGLFGPKGAGLVSQLGLEKDVAVRLNTFGKAVGAQGAVVLANWTVKNVLINYARCFTFSTAPSFVMLAAIKAAYNLMERGETEARQAKVFSNVKYFHQKLFEQSVYKQAREKDIIFIEGTEEWDDNKQHSHIVGLRGREGENQVLSFHLLMAGICAWPISYPVVPKGKGRIRMIFHANNTEEQIDYLVSVLMDFAQFVMDTEAEVEKETGATGRQLEQKTLLKMETEGIALLSGYQPTNIPVKADSKNARTGVAPVPLTS